MHLAALLIAEHTDQQFNTVDLTAAPNYVVTVPALPARVVVPVEAVVWSEPGEDTQAEFQLLCMTADSDVLTGIRHAWDWLEQDGILTKYHVFTHAMEFIADDAGLYYIGIGGDDFGDEPAIVPFVVVVNGAFDAIPDPFVDS
jgi:hypothetical protein